MKGSPPSFQYPKTGARDWFEPCRPSASPAGRCIAVSRQLQREKSLVPECSEISANLADNSKGIFGNDISRFESYMPSHAVWSLQRVSVLWQNMRHSRPLRGTFLGLRTKANDYNGVSIGDFGPQSPSENFQYPNFPGGDSVRTCGDWFEMSMIGLSSLSQRVSFRKRSTLGSGKSAKTRIVHGIGRHVVASWPSWWRPALLARQQRPRA